MKALSLSEVERRLAPKGIRIIGDYSSAITRTMFSCGMGHRWIATPSKVMRARGTGCPHCSKCAPLSMDAVNARLAGRGIRMIGPYTSALSKGLFECEAGHRWNAEVNSVMKANGCPHCGNRIPLTLEDVQERIKASGIRIVGNYTGTHRKTTACCKEGHEWKVKPTALLRGHGCPKCANRGFDVSKPAILYLLMLEGEELECPIYKIGVTNRRVSERAQQFLSGTNLSYRIVEALPFSDGRKALDAEKRIKARNKNKRYTVPIKGLTGGYTEIFNENVWEDQL